MEDTYFLFSANHRAACKGAIDAMSYDYAKWGFKGVVIATDDFSLLNTLIRLEAWKGWGWKTGPDAKSVVCGNKDLLMELDEKLKKQREQGVQIYFWDIKQEQNLANDLATKG